MMRNLLLLWNSGDTATYLMELGIMVAIAVLLQVGSHLLNKASK